MNAHTIVCTCKIFFFKHFRMYEIHAFHYQTKMKDIILFAYWFRIVALKTNITTTLCIGA